MTGDVDDVGFATAWWSAHAHAGNAPQVERLVTRLHEVIRAPLLDLSTRPYSRPGIVVVTFRTDLGSPDVQNAIFDIWSQARAFETSWTLTLSDEVSGRWHVTMTSASATGPRGSHRVPGLIFVEVQASDRPSADWW